MVEKGEIAPDFQSKLHDGRAFQLASLKGRPVVLYFYPQADTPGCTIEAKGFRDHIGEFAAAGVEIVGVSTDDCPAQQAFVTKYGLPFRLVADADRKVSSAYGVLRPGGRDSRVTFLIGPDGRVGEIVQGVKAEEHVARARAYFLKG